jgi:hypothetical protein
MAGVYVMYEDSREPSSSSIVSKTDALVLRYYSKWKLSDAKTC